jgi:HK97 family phage major capsid protein
MNQTATPTRDGQLRDTRRQLEPARQDAQAKWSAFEKKRDEAVAAGTIQDSSVTSVLDGLHKAASEAAESHEVLRDSERLLSAGEVLSPAGVALQRTVGAALSDGAHAGVDMTTHAELTATPGALLASMLDRRRRDVPTLPEHIRFAQSTPITTGNVDTVTESSAVIDLLSPFSVAIASGIPVLRIGTTKTRVPRFTQMPEAEWIPELGTFPKNGPGIEMVDVEPPKVGLITEVSIEVFEDLSPLLLSMLQVQLLRGIAVKFDAGMLFGRGIGAEPIGVANTPAIQAVVDVPLTSLAAFAQGLAALIAVNAKPGALVMNPVDVGALLALTESEDGAGSNVPLWKASVGSASGLRLPYFDTPIWPTPACPRGEALMYDPATVLAVLRREADIAIDPYYGFDNGVVGLRTYLRGQPVVGQEDGAVTIAFGYPATMAAADDTIAVGSQHPFANGNTVRLNNLAGAAPLAESTTYYVRDATLTTVKLAATAGGAAINLTSDGSGRLHKV